MLFRELENITRVKADGCCRVGEFRAVELDGAGGDKLFFKLAVGFTQAKSRLKSVVSQGEDVEISGGGRNGNLR